MPIDPTVLDARRRLAKEIRRDVLRMTSAGKASHVGSNFSMVEILATLYGGVLRVDPKDATLASRDRFLLSKGHACAAVYSALARNGFFPVEWLDRFYRDGSPLWGHISHAGVPGVEASTGALGHGLPIACGMALAAKRDGRGSRVYAILSDGECDEGSNWEAALFAGHFALDNLVAIVDYNKIQSFGRTAEVLDLDPLAAKWRAFRWDVREIDGHDLAAIDAAFGDDGWTPGRPRCIVAHTVKGKGVSFMEDQLLWHYRAPAGEELERALAEIEVSR